ncbi:MAG: heme-copper oxidase subunit III [Elusimicrobia bacterium]|nr:heme-copper oxidase subunit III [Elusimicrobiota bacterium]
MTTNPPDIGRYGMWFFILSEIMLFGAFIAAYVMLRWGSSVCALGAPAWPKTGYLGGLTLATINTLLLITSSFTMVRAVLASEEKNSVAFRRFMGATLLLGLGFLAVKIFEYYLKIHHGYYPRSEFMEATPGLNIFISFYFVLTGFHGLHVLIGVLWNFFLFKRGKGPLDERFGRKVEYAGLYWHFVDAVWVFMFPLFYLI